MHLKFCGAARQVTGSCFLFETGSVSFLVDCGLFRGGRQERAQNEARFAFDPKRVGFVILTHAHLDHCGLLPRLAAEGFAGPVYTTAATRDLADVLLQDSAYLQKVDAERAQRHGRDVVPLYDLAQTQALIRQVRPQPYEQIFVPAAGIRVRLRDAGHILGSAIVEMWVTEKDRTFKIVVTGDLGEPGRAIVRDPAFIKEADVLLIESTYGNRDHRALGATLDELVMVLNEGLSDGAGVVLVPAFAVGRTQEFLYHLEQLTAEQRLRPLDVFVDSPMAQAATQITSRHFELFDAEARQAARQDRQALRLRFTETPRDSMALNRIESGAVIVAASGMCDGGRIRHHLRHRLANPHTTIVFIGYQAAGTLGRRLVEGARSVRIFGEEIPVRARIVTLGGFSAHAGQSSLLDWLGHLEQPPSQLFLVHGEEATCTAFAAAIEKRLGWRAHIPAQGESVELVGRVI
jgi:metallo-beta-lactamase family protein